MDEVKRVYLTWSDVDDLIGGLLTRLRINNYDVLITITRGGIIPGGIIAAQLAIPQVLVASVDFYEDQSLDLDWPVFMQFPADSFLVGKQVLIVDDVWYKGKEVMSVTDRVELAGGRSHSAVLHYKEARSIFEDKAPTYYAAKTDDWIIYPWEVDRSFLGV